MPATTDPTATDAPNTAPATEDVQPRSAAARRAAGEKVSTPIEEPVASSGIAAVDAEVGPISAAELAEFRAFKQSRTNEIMEKIKEAPTAIGTDLNPFTLVHLRGCPQPDRTETYTLRDPAEREFTVHRCIECGAHLAIPH